MPHKFKKGDLIVLYSLEGYTEYWKSMAKERNLLGKLYDNWFYVLFDSDWRIRVESGYHDESHFRLANEEEEAMYYLKKLRKS